MRLMRPSLLVLIASWLAGLVAWAGPAFRFPTANRALLEPGREEKFFVGTAGRPWTSGQFGCVRSDGQQFHEGLDIRCLQRDRQGEPTDPVLAAADGSVAYINARSSLSNYGKYLILRHSIEGFEIYTLYAHLSAIEPGLKSGTTVRAGQTVGTLGRTTNTQQPITKDRAHLHFEINLVVNDRYAQWHGVRLKGLRNDHGNFNGRNLLGIDPAELFREQYRLGAKFSLTEFIRDRPVMVRVVVRDTSLPWLKRYPQLIQRNPLADREGIAGYELGLTFNGVPVRVIPRAASELKSKLKVQLLDVNQAEWQRRPCGKLVVKRGQVWSLLPRGQDLVDLLTY